MLCVWSIQFCTSINYVHVSYRIQKNLKCVNQYKSTCNSIIYKKSYYIYKIVTCFYQYNLIHVLYFKCLDLHVSSDTYKKLFRTIRFVPMQLSTPVTLFHHVPSVIHKKLFNTIWYTCCNYVFDPIQLPTPVTILFNTIWYTCYMNYLFEPI